VIALAFFCTLFAYAQYELIERPLLKLSSISSHLACLVVYALIAGIILINRHGQEAAVSVQMRRSTTTLLVGITSETIARAIAENEKIKRDCYHVLPIEPLECKQDAQMREIATKNGFDWLVKKLDNEKTKREPNFLYYCMIENKQGSSNNKTVMLLGNSFAARTLNGVLEALEGRYSKLYLFSRPICSPFDALNEGSDESKWQCSKAPGLSFLLAEALRPDWVFISQSMHTLNPCNESIGKNLHEDNCWLGLEAGLNRMAQISQHVFLIEPNVVSGYVSPATKAEGVPATIAKRLSIGKPINDITTSYAQVAGVMGLAWLRLSTHTCELKATCSMVPLQQEFCDGVKCRLYDPDTLFSYYCDDSHLSVYGARMAVPMLKRAILAVRSRDGSVYADEINGGGGSDNGG